MKILMVASEANPLAKTGGLADVVYALSRELADGGDDVSVVMPLYGSMFHDQSYQVRQVASYDVILGWRNQRANLFETKIDGIRYLLIENQYYFGREGLYGYADDIERFAFFTVAVKEMIRLGIIALPDIIHLHDWQPGMLPVLIKEQIKELPAGKIKTILTIHNPAFQGLFSPDLLTDFYGLPRSLYDNGQVRFFNQVGTLKSAIVYADKITTVSPTHAQELLTKEGGKGLESVIALRKNDFCGILNGIDYHEFNPATDHLIAQKFHHHDFIAGKSANRAQLMADLHLTNDLRQPLFGIVSRLTWQKGIDLIDAAIRPALAQGALFVVLGSGEPESEKRMLALAEAFPEQVAVYIGYNQTLAHQIYAAADIFLMPSLFEPCGSGQMIAHRYGTLPLVRFTGGLIDTVIDYDGKNVDIADGFGFVDYNAEALALTIKRAMKTFMDKNIWNILIENALKQNNDWKKSGQAYRSLYAKLL